MKFLAVLALFAVLTRAFAGAPVASCDVVGENEFEGALCEFSNASEDYFYHVPTGVSSIRISAWGAAGGSYSLETGGPGGYASGEFAVSSGELLLIRVGEGGAGSTHDRASGSGGGASGVRRSPYADADRLLVAGGGGGTGCKSSVRSGGAGGGSASAPAENAESFPQGGGAGTQTAPGVRGLSSRRNGVSGLAGEGGEGTSSGTESPPSGSGRDGYIQSSRPRGDGQGGRGFRFSTDCGHGGGGGGFFGGASGGGDTGGYGGGGGSGFIHPSAINVESEAGSSVAQLPGGDEHPLRGDAGSPGFTSSARGNDGKVIIEVVV